MPGNISVVFSGVINARLMNSDSDNFCGKNRITTALLLSEGTSSRLVPLTKSFPKCPAIVTSKFILARLINNIKSQGFKQLNHYLAKAELLFPREFEPVSVPQKFMVI